MSSSSTDAEQRLRPSMSSRRIEIEQLVQDLTNLGCSLRLQQPVTTNHQHHDDVDDAYASFLIRYDRDIHSTSYVLIDRFSITMQLNLSAKAFPHLHYDFIHSFVRSRRCHEYLYFIHSFSTALSHIDSNIDHLSSSLLSMNE